MKQKPRNPSEPIIDQKHWRALIVYSIIISITSMAAVYSVHYRTHQILLLESDLCNNVLFLTLIFSQLFHVFNITEDHNKPFFKTDVVKNKYVWYAILICTVFTAGSFFIEPVANALRLDNLSLLDWSIIISFSLLSAFINRVLKKLKLTV
jgi:Ca2+-transporting ATPase